MIQKEAWYREAFLEESFQELSRTDQEAYFRALLRSGQSLAGKLPQSFLSKKARQGLLVGANLSGITLRRLSFKKADLRDVDFSNARLHQLSIEGSNCSGANFSHSTLSSVRLENSILRESDFSKSSLYRVDMRRCTFQGSNFSEAVVRMTDMNASDFSGVNFQKSTLDGIGWHSNYSGADFRGADLTLISFQRGNLEGADLRRALYDPPTLLDDTEGTPIQDPWYREASLESDLLRLEEEIKAGEGDSSEWVQIQESGILERAWALSERIGTLPNMDRQQAEYVDEQTKHYRVFTVNESARDVGKYHGDPEGDWVEFEPVRYSLPDLLEELRYYTWDGKGYFSHTVQITSEGYWPTVMGLKETRIHVEGLDVKGHKILEKWAHE